MFDLWAAARNDQRQVKFQFQTGTTADPRRYNAPSVSEVAAIYDGEAPPTNRGIMVYPQPSAGGGFTHRVNFLSDHLDPRAYPLLFPDGQRGWCPKLKYCNVPGAPIGTRSKVAQADFFAIV